jgi:hypothetical protein
LHSFCTGPEDQAKTPKNSETRKGRYTMREHSSHTSGYPVVINRILSFLLFGVLTVGIAAPAGSGEVTDNARPVAQQTSTRLFYFNLQFPGTYDVQTNESTVAIDASPNGTLSFLDAATPGETVVVTLTGSTQLCPDPPAGFQADAASNSCVRLSWLTPPREHYVSKYKVYWGTTSRRPVVLHHLRFRRRDVLLRRAWLEPVRLLERIERRG